MRIDWTQYNPTSFYDELFDSPGHARPAAERLVSYLTSLGVRELTERQRDADRAIRGNGHHVHRLHAKAAIDRPRVAVRHHPAHDRGREWERIEQRPEAARSRARTDSSTTSTTTSKIIDDGVVPASLIATSTNFRAGVHRRKSAATASGRTSAAPIWCATRDGTVYVLEDNLRVPSGVSYMLENRAVMKRVFPELFEDCAILPVDDYADRSCSTCCASLVAAQGRRAATSSC